MMNETHETRISFSSQGRRLTAPVIARLMTQALESPGLLSLAAGFTDTATLPVREVGDGVQRLLSREGPPECLQYGTNQGRPGLRSLIGERLRQQDGVAGEASSDEILITNGSQQLLYLAVRVLCDPGDLILVERPTYFVFLEMLRGAGVEARSIPTGPDGRIDGEGLWADLEKMKASGEIERLKAVYLVSYFANPSGNTLERAEKEAVASALRRANRILPVVEDAAYRELYYRRPAEAPGLFALEAFSGFPLLYAGTLTKPFATGLKVGFGVCNDSEWRHRMLYLKGQQDFGTAHFPQAIMEEMLSGSAFEDHLRTLRENYRRKMERLHGVLLEEGLSEAGWSWKQPGGGLYLWLRGPEGMDTGIDSDFCRTCIEEGVLYVPGELCFAEGRPGHFVRLSFGVLSEENLGEAGKRFARVAKKFVS